MFEINATLPIFVASFLLFMILLNEVMLKPVGKVIAKRAAKISDDLEAGKHAHAEADRLLAHYQEHLHKVRSEAQAIINKAMDAANEKRDGQIHSLKADFKQKLEKAKKEIADERGNLLDQLIEQEIMLVQEIAHKLLGDGAVVKLDHKDVRRALEEAC